MLYKVVLLIGFPGETAAALSAALSAAGFGTMTVPPERSALPLASILEGRQGLAAGERPPEPVIVFHGLGGSELDAALAVLRERGAGTALKAMTTPTNLRWTPSELWKNLSAERKAIGKGKRKH